MDIAVTVMLFSIYLSCWTVCSGAVPVHWSICHTQYGTGVLSWVKTGSIHAHTGHPALEQQWSRGVFQCWDAVDMRAGEVYLCIIMIPLFSSSAPTHCVTH